MTGTKKIAHVLWRSQGGIRRHVRAVASNPPCGWQTSAVWGPRELASYFEGVPFVPVTRPQLLTAGGDADVIHAHGITAGIRAVPRHRPPVVTTLHVVHGGSGSTARSGFAASIARLIVSRADVVVAVSRAGAEGFDHARVIPPAFDPLPSPARSRDAVRSELGASPSDVVAIVVARADATKRLELFVDAVERAGCIGWIVGDGPDLERIRAYAEGSRTQTLGSRSDVADLLGAADLFALPSASETYGIAVAEAIAAGLPVVATDTGAISELVGEAGVVVDPSSTDRFVDGVVTVAGDPELRRRYAEAARATPAVDVEARIAQLGAVYDELAGSR